MGTRTGFFARTLSDIADCHAIHCGRSVGAIKKQGDWEKRLSEGICTKLSEEVTVGPGESARVCRSLICVETRAVVCRIERWRIEMLHGMEKSAVTYSN